MARVTIEDCVEHVKNRFQLVHAAVRRSRQLMEGSKPLVASKNRDTIVALREIASAQVKVSTSPSKLDIPKPNPLAQEEEEAIAGAAIGEIGVEQIAAEEPESERTDEESGKSRGPREAQSAEEAGKEE